jgi:formylglycine-generating enzyme required for sulfatase activity
MKALTLLILLFATIAIAEDFTTVAGKEYKNVTVSQVEPDGLVLMTSTGVVKLYFTDLPKEVQEKYHYDAAKAGAGAATDAKEEEAKIANATKEHLWENSLGMKFVRIPGTNALFSIWDTRVQDYEAFAKATGRAWQRPSFSQGSTHPAVNVTWKDAKAFGEWLTQEERKAGRLSTRESYRLPTDAEWSAAVGLKAESGRTPEERSKHIGGIYPWGKEWPPSKGAGNYNRALNVDDYEKTSPVGSFRANQFGLYDMGGNVWQWCEDWYESSEQSRVERGGSWRDRGPGHLLSSYRDHDTPDTCDGHTGFRCVLVAEFLR